MAYRNGNQSVIEYLINLKADINALDKLVELLYLIENLFHIQIDK